MSDAAAKPGSAPRPEAGDAAAYYATPRGKLSLWTGVLGGAVAWAAHFQIGYALARFTYTQPWLGGLHHAATALAVLAAAGATLLAWRDWRRIGGGEPSGAEDGVWGRSRFMAALGIFTSGLFTLVILAQWVPVFFLDPAWY